MNADSRSALTSSPYLSSPLLLSSSSLYPLLLLYFRTLGHFLYLLYYIWSKESDITTCLTLIIISHYGITTDAQYHMRHGDPEHGTRSSRFFSLDSLFFETKPKQTKSNQIRLVSAIKSDSVIFCSLRRRSVVCCALPTDSPDRNGPLHPSQFMVFIVRRTVGGDTC